jgi:hypothetical protein
MVKKLKLPVDQKWVRLLAYVTGSVNQELLLQNEYLAAENRMTVSAPRRQQAALVGAST